MEQQLQSYLIASLSSIQCLAQCTHRSLGCSRKTIDKIVFLLKIRSCIKYMTLRSWLSCCSM